MEQELTNNMQTFLPYPNFTKTAKCLDYRRLGKQRVEAYQIFRVLMGWNKKNKHGKVAWANHPAVLMWEGYVPALGIYMNEMIGEWILRGYKNNMTMVFMHPNQVKEYPPWLGDEDFHNSHKSNLLRKDSEYYGKFNWGITDDLPYVWPVKENIREVFSE